MNIKLSKNIPPRAKWFIFGIVAVIILIIAGQQCSSDKPPVGHLTANRDSLPVLTTIGVSSLISDSGYTRYRIIAEEWEMYDKTNPPRNVFPKGLFLQRFNNKFQMDLYITADTAWCFDQNLWKFKGHVLIKDLEQKTTFQTEELFWNREQHRFYSNTWIQITKPDRKLEGNRFWANEAFTQYEIHKGSGYTPIPSDKDDHSSPSTNNQETDSLTQPYERTPAEPFRKQY